MSNKLTAEFLKKFATASQIEALKNLRESKFNPKTDKLDKEISTDDIAGDINDFLKSELSSVFSENDLEEMFKIIDADGNGKISKAEALEFSQTGDKYGNIDDSDIVALFGTVKEYNGDIEENSNQQIQGTKESLITTRDGRTAGIVNFEELPKGYSISGEGKIYDAHWKEIGISITIEKDIDSDGISDSISSYYLYSKASMYKEPEPEVTYQVEEATLPYGSYTVGNKILDNFGFQIGRIEESIEDATGDGKANIIKKFLLFEKPEEQTTTLTSTEENINKNVIYTKEGKKATIVGINDLPPGYTITLSGKIYDRKNNEIGLSRTLTVDINGDGIRESITLYYMYDSKSQVDETQPEAKYQVQSNEIPYTSYVSDDKILDSNGYQIGTIEKTDYIDPETGKLGEIEKYFLFNEPSKRTISNPDGTETWIENKTDGTRIVTNFDEYGNKMSEITTAVNGNITTKTYKIEDGKVILDTIVTVDKDGNVVTDENTDTSTETPVDAQTKKGISPIEKNVDRIKTTSGETAKAVNKTDLPEGYQINAVGKIYDKNNNEIGLVRTRNIDVDGDGTIDSITSYYLYEKKTVAKVDEKDLPQDIRSIGDKLYDESYNFVGYKKVIESNETDEFGNHIMRTEYYLFDNTDEDYTTDYTGKKAQVKQNELPLTSFIRGKKIYNSKGFEIGYIEEKKYTDSVTGKTSIIKKYFMYQ